MADTGNFHLFLPFFPLAPFLNFDQSLFILEPKVKYKSIPTCSQTPVSKSTFTHALAHHTPVLAESAQRFVTTAPNTGNENEDKGEMRTKQKSKPRGKQNCHNYRERLSLAPTRPARDRSPVQPMGTGGCSSEPPRGRRVSCHYCRARKPGPGAVLGRRTASRRRARSRRRPRLGR